MNSPLLGGEKRVPREARNDRQRRTARNRCDTLRTPATLRGSPRSSGQAGKAVGGRYISQIQEKMRSRRGIRDANSAPRTIIRGAHDASGDLDGPFEALGKLKRRPYNWAAKLV